MSLYKSQIDYQTRRMIYDEEYKRKKYDLVNDINRLRYLTDEDFMIKKRQQSRDNYYKKKSLQK